MTAVNRVPIRRVMSVEDAKQLLNKPVREHYEPNAAPRSEWPAVYYDADTGDDVMALFEFPGEIDDFRWACRTTKQSTVLRAGGIRSDTAAFGAVSRSGMMRRAACSACALSAQQPKQHEIICGVAAQLWTRLQEVSEFAAAATRLPLAEVHPAWRMGLSPWTSGVLNDTAALPYHYDKNNYPGAWSVMPSLRRLVTGAHLHFPEYGITLATGDGDVQAFAGSLLVHGVTPLRRELPGGYRFSCVFYPVHSMRNCLPPEEEIEHARQSRTATEDTLLERQREAGLLK